MTYEWCEWCGEEHPSGSRCGESFSAIELETADLTFIAKRVFDASEIVQFYKINILSLREADGK